jgi:hypothetical protein
MFYVSPRNLDINRGREKGKGADCDLSCPHCHSCLRLQKQDTAEQLSRLFSGATAAAAPANDEELCVFAMLVYNPLSKAKQRILCFLDRRREIGRHRLGASKGFDGPEH